MSTTHNPLHAHIERDGFRLRGLEMSRIDAFSDVVFGFALTLLVVSLEVPRTYAELHHALRGFIPFAISFYFLMTVWLNHYRFFRRYGLHDLGTIAINAVLLFVVLFFVYPLKFLFTFLVALMTGDSLAAFDSMHQVRELMVLYGLGFAAIYLVLGCLYLNARRQRQALALTPIELYLTHTYLVELFGTAAIALLSCLVAWLVPLRWTGMAGWTYILIAPFKTLYGPHTRRVVARMRAAEHLAAPPPPEPDDL